jgi:hypothetical protein
VLDLPLQDRHLQYLAARRESWLALEVVHAEEARLLDLLDEVVALYTPRCLDFARFAVAQRGTHAPDLEGAVRAGLTQAVLSYQPHLHWAGHLEHCLNDALRAASDIMLPFPDEQAGARHSPAA